ncbi:MAG: PAS domain S-box protein [Chloroflexi bacterium]|nr:PAS domain S-box protein [Chloroflexota bacterium]
MKILIVDDNATNRKLLRVQLQAEGHTLREAEDGKRALELLKSEPFDALISDILMPSLDGYGLCIEIRKIKKLQRLPVIIYTATYTSPGDEKLAHDAGADRYVKKPAQTQVILDALHEIMLRKRSRRVVPRRRKKQSEVMKEYSERLIRKIEEKHIELVHANEGLREKSAALEASEKRFRALIEKSVDAIALANPDGTILYASPAAARIVGTTPEEMIGRNTFDGMHPDDVGCAYQIFASLREKPGNSMPLQVRFRHKDGSWRWVDGIGTNLLAEPSVGALVANYRDETERKHAEEALRESEARYHTVVESATDIIYTVSVEGNILSINAAFESVTGWPRSEWLGQPFASLIYSDDIPALAERIQRTLQGEVLPPTEIRIRMKSGAYCYMEGTSGLLQDERGGIAILGIVRDITERKRAEEEIKRRAEEFAALYETALNLSAQYELSALLQTIADNAAKLLKSNSATMYLYDSASDELELTVKTEYPFPIGARLKMGEGMAGRVAQSREPQIVDDYQTWESRSSLFEGVPLRAVAEVPMLYGGNLIGVLAVTELGESRRKYSQADLRLLSLFASPAASAVHNARLLEETRQRAEQLALLYDAGLTLNRVLDSQQQLKFLCKIAMKALRADSASFLRYDPTRDELRLEIGLGLEPADLAEMEKHIFPAGEEHGLVGWVAQQRIPLYIPDVTTDSRWIRFDSATRSALWVPIIHEQELRGVLSVTHVRVNAFTPQDERLLILFANQISVAMETARLFEETRQRLKRLVSLRAIDVAISNSLDLRVTLDVILEQVKQQLKVDASAVLLMNPHMHVLEYAASRGFRTREIEHSQLRVGEGIAGRAAMERKTVFIPDLRAAGETIPRVEMFKTEDFVSCVATPLVVKGEVKGVLEILHRAPLNPDPDWQDFLQALAGQSAIAIDNANLFQNLQRSNTDLWLAYDTTIEGWSRAMDLRDKETEGHTQRVTEMAMRLLRAAGIRESEIVHARRGALLHDIGKMGVPDGILLKPGKLTDEEWQQMRKHPGYAHALLLPIAYLKPALDIPYCHHEKWDGTGYPRGLKGEQIPLAARMFAVVDVYDALISERPYRAAWSKEKAIEFIRSQSGTHFEPVAVEAFMTVLNQA